ncbi:ATP-grasp domain-containing protein [Cardiobacteriaceae bacterium TAE3-ERU3]|nr:ATP-grasp domain-containing protein [Cardiobacteriaceae bacterium TAE3-ERU3]
MSQKTHIGFLGPQPYMKAAIDTMNEHLVVHELNPKTWSDEEMDAMAQTCCDEGISAVAGFAQKDAFHHILINERLGNTVPSRLAFLYCMNKYLMRTLEANPFWFDYVDPMNESDEEIIAKITEWPFMLKNTSLSLGRGIFKIKNEDDLRSVLKSYREDKELQDLIAYQNAEYMKGIPEDKLPPVIPPFIAEHMVDMNTAVEYCYEGYITADGEIVHYALTEEVYFSNHQALGYVTPPISIDADTAAKIEAWVDDYMGRFAELGYVGQFFNLEFWIMPDGTIALTEINPRAAHSYHYNYLYSFGNSLYEDNLKLAATGKRLEEKTPWQKWRDGDDFIYTLIILLTANKTGKVSDILDYDYVRQLEEDEGVLIRHTRQADDVLTENDMTAAGVMLQQMWVTGKTKRDVIAREHEVREKIFRDANVEGRDYPPYWSL